MTRGRVQVVVKTNGSTGPVPPGWEMHPVSLEELALAYLRDPGGATLPGPARGSNAEPSEVTK